MEEMLRQYGGAIIAGISVAAIFSLFLIFWTVEDDAGGSGQSDIFSDLGGRSQELNRASNETIGADSNSFDVVATRKNPVVTVQTSSVKQRTQLDLLSMFTIQTNEGNAWTINDLQWNAAQGVLKGRNNTAAAGGLVEVKNIRYQDGTDLLGHANETQYLNYNQQTAVVTFLRAGVYHVTIRVMDRENVESTYTLPISIDFVPED